MNDTDYYVVSGYQHCRSMVPCVKIYGIFVNFFDAVHEINLYTHKNVDEISEYCSYIQGNGYTLWIQKVSNNIYWNNNGIAPSSGNRINFGYVCKANCSQP